MPEDSTREEVPAPDAMNPAALRWVRFVVNHFAPKPGDVVVIKYPNNDYGKKKGRKMADALERVLESQDARDGVLIIDTPARYLDISHLPESEMNEAGWFRHPPESNDPDAS